MPTSEPLEILLAHDAWATRQILDACTALTSEQFHKPFEMGAGSLHNNTLHILGAMGTWIQTLAGQDVGPRLDQDGRQRTPAEMIELHATLAHDLAVEAHRRPLTELVQRGRDGKIFSFTRGIVVTHVTTHSMHHRAQCLNMLRHVGVKPLPRSGIAEWSRIADSAS